MVKRNGKKKRKKKRAKKKKARVKIDRRQRPKFIYGDMDEPWIDSTQISYRSRRIVVRTMDGEKALSIVGGNRGEVEKRLAADICAPDDSGASGNRRCVFDPVSDGEESNGVNPGYGIEASRHR